MPPCVQALHQFVLSKLKQKWVANSRLNMLAAMVDPNFKKLDWLTAGDRQQEFEFMLEEMEACDKGAREVDARLQAESMLPSLPRAAAVAPVPPARAPRSIFDIGEDEDGDAPPVALAVAAALVCCASAFLVSVLCSCIRFFSRVYSVVCSPIITQS
jgi:hypothetical protein